MNIEKITAIVKETDKIFFDSGLKNDVRKKGEADFVTKADIAISEYLHKRLTEEFPDVGFLSEEEEPLSSDREKYWILDPIDGTTNFMYGIGLCGVSLGYCENSEITAGVIYIPQSGEMFWAIKGNGAYLNGERIKCGTAQKLSDCLALYEFNAYFKEEHEQAAGCAEKIYTSCRDIRTLGSAAVEMAYIACGRADAFFGRYLKPWDYAAGTIIVREAGGVVSYPEGEITYPETNRHIIATNSEMHRDFKKRIL